MAVGSVPRETVVQMPEGGASMEAQQQESSAETATAGPISLPRCKSRLFSWRVAGAVLALLVVLGWIFIIVMLILEEKWQLVLVAWLLLYSAAHFCYWYCKRHSLITLHRHIRLRVLTHSRNAENGEKADKPPTYDEVMKTEAPPPAYFTVVSEAFKMPSAGVSPCVPADVPSVSSCVEKQQSQAASGNEDSKKTKSSKKMKNSSNMLTIEIRECPPAYQSPRSPRALSPRILPSIHEAGGSLVTATAAASAAATATAAFSYFVPTTAGDADAAAATTAAAEDPIRNPIVQHLRSATMPTLEVSSNVDVSNGSAEEEGGRGEVTRNVRDQIEEVDVHRSSIL
ncbi:uncharacterized protein LOC135199969 isoform X2 [Macrobrachium nipponense]|uniref:uncharacterized protein LOC135199969 isoform X2 n=1 Tax=Macrobrachium nipponense TaxID=159736 RepID=UPI0030C7FD14